MDGAPAALQVDLDRFLEQDINLSSYNTNHLQLSDECPLIKHFIKTPKRLEAFQLTSVGVGTSSLVSSGALTAIIVWSLKTSILQMSSYVT